jgi:hypothetical protein
MPFQVTWYHSDRVIYVRLEGLVTLEEISGATEKVIEHVYQGTPPVHVLSDLRDMHKFPTNLVDISRSVKPMDNTILGYTLIVGLNPVVRFLTSAISQFFKARYRTFNTPDEALAFLAEVDPSAFTNQPRETLPTK